ncbi:hypothetical protein [Paraburkholderia sp. RL17-337-BIB-A]|uniref:hypothetical protein n=1 Tax=Paraburkholderia sp. RL17-337-BIB-A TaxID=3031636 RepID=UPI0038BA8B2E
MGQKFAAYNAQGAIMAFYDSVDSPVPEGVTAIEITDAQWQTCIATSGYTVVNGALVAPTPPAPPTAAQIAAQALIQSAQTAMAAGISIVSTGTPALNGTYACDQLSQMDIIAIETSLNAGKGFPGGATTFNYPDVTGVMHSFTEADFTNFAAAVRDFVYGCKSVIAGASTTLPSSAVTIA